MRSTALSLGVALTLSAAPLVCPLGVQRAAAQTLDQVPCSATHLALAEAALVGLSRSSTALWVNPAELAALGGRLTVDSSVAFVAGERSTVQAGEGAVEGRDVGSATAAPAVAAALAVWRGRIWLGIGYRQQHRLRSRYLLPVQTSVPTASTELTDSDPMRYLGSELSLADHRIALGAALRIGWLRVGVAAELALLRLSYRRTLWAGFEDDPAPLSGDPAQTVRHDVEARLDLDGPSYGVRFGVSASPTRWLELAATVRLPVRAVLSGPLSVRRPCDTNRPDCSPVDYQIAGLDGSGELDLDLPLGVAAGLALRPHARLRLLVAGTYSRWSAADGLAASADRAAVLVDQAADDSLDGVYPLASLPLGIGLRDTYSVHAGLDLVLVAGFLRARVGWAFLRGATATDQPSPVAVDLDRHLVAGGLNLGSERWAISLAVAQSIPAQLSSRAERTGLVNPLLPDETGPAFAGIYRAHNTRVMLEIGFAWDGSSNDTNR